VGLLDGFLGGGGPSLNVVPLDPQTQAKIGTQVSNATQTDQQFSDKMNAGVRDAGAQGLQTDSQAQARASQTGENPASLQAIRNQYNKVAGDSIGGVVRQNQTNAAMTRANWMQSAARSAIAQQQVQTQNYEMMTQAMNQADMARAQLLSNILGVGGMAGGMYLAGGFGGHGGMRTRQGPTTAGGPMDAGGMNQFQLPIA
jgi:hypothetical protein